MTDWIQAICSGIGVILAFIGILFSLPKLSKAIKTSTSERIDKLEKQLREHIRGFTDEQAEETIKNLKEIYSRPEMRRP